MSITQLAKENRLTIKYLIDLETRKELDVNERDADKRNALYYAIEHHNHEVAKWLIEKMGKEKLSIKNNYFLIPCQTILKTVTKRGLGYVSLAAYCNNLEIVKYFCSSNNNSKKYIIPQEIHPLLYAISNSSLEIIEFFFQHFGYSYIRSQVTDYDAKEDCMCWSLYLKQFLSLQLLINHKIPPLSYDQLSELNLSFTLGWTPIHYVCWYGTECQIIEVLALGGYKDWYKVAGKCADKTPIQLLKENKKISLFNSSKIEEFANDLTKNHILPILTYFVEQVEFKTTAIEKIKYLKNLFVILKEGMNIIIETKINKLKLGDNIKKTLDRLVTLLIHAYLDNQNILEAEGLLKVTELADPKIYFRLAICLLKDQTGWEGQNKNINTQKILKLIKKFMTGNSEEIIKILIGLYSKWNVTVSKPMISVSEILQAQLNKLTVDYQNLQNSSLALSKEIIDQSDKNKILQSQIEYLRYLYLNCKTSSVAIQEALKLPWVVEELDKQNEEFLVIESLVLTFPLLPQPRSCIPENRIVIANQGEFLLSQLKMATLTEKIATLKAQLSEPFSKTKEVILYNKKLKSDEFVLFLNTGDANDIFDAFLKFGNIQKDVKQPKNTSKVTHDLKEGEEKIVDIYNQYQKVINDNTAFIALHRTFLQSNITDVRVKKTIHLVSQILQELSEQCELASIQKLISTPEIRKSFFSLKRSTALKDRVNDLLLLSPEILLYRFGEYMAYLNQIFVNTSVNLSVNHAKEYELVKLLLNGIEVAVQNIKHGDIQVSNNYLSDNVL